MLAATMRLTLGSLSLDASLTVQPGELLALLGPNGAGKSTILRCLAGLVALDDGRIVIDDVVLDDPSAAMFVEPEDRRVGVVFQDYLLFGNMTVVDNVAFGLRARGIAKGEALAAAEAWIERFGLSQYASQRPAALSGGQAQRVALARALATNPLLLLLDEPLAALDAGTRSAVRRDLRRYLDGFEGMRIMVTHDPVDAYALADRVAIVDGGRIVQMGTLAEVTAHPKSRYVADLIGVNLVTGIVTDGVLVTASGARIVIADAPAGPSFAVIRPQAISVHVRLDDAGSPRNTWSATIVELDRLGDRVRVGLGGELDLIAEITVGALSSLALNVGDSVWMAVKATDIEVYPA